ncbi:MAG: hypothetical protein RLZZ592_1136 [Pseudomonadota bacterium]
MRAGAAIAPVLMRIDPPMPGPLVLRRGEQIALVDEEGAAASQLLALLCGDARPAQGEVRLLDRALGAWSLEALSRRRAMLGGRETPLPGLDVQGCVALGRVARRPDPARQDIAREALRAVDALDLAGRLCSRLEPGCWLRVRIARWMAQLWDTTHGVMLLDLPPPQRDSDALPWAAISGFARERGHALVVSVSPDCAFCWMADRLWPPSQAAAA